MPSTGQFPVGPLPIEKLLHALLDHFSLLAEGRVANREPLRRLHDERHVADSHDALGVGSAYD